MSSDDSLSHTAETEIFVRRTNVFPLSLAFTVVASRLHNDHDEAEKLAE